MYNDQFAKLNREQKNKIAAKEAELKQIKLMGKKEIEAAHIQKENDLADIHTRNQIELAEAAGSKQEKLDKFNKELKDNQARLEKEYQNLTSTNRQKIESMNQRFNERYHSQFQASAEKADAIKEKTNYEIQKIQLENDQEVINKQFATKKVIDDLNRSGDLKIKKTNKDFKSLQDQQKIEQAKMQSQSKLSHEEKMRGIFKKNMIEKTYHTNRHAMELQSDQKLHQEKLKSEKQSFEQKYKKLQEDHNLILARVKNQFSVDLQNLIKSKTDARASITEKADDPFYHIGKLNPIIQELPDAYIISLEVPAHEKENVQLSSNERQLNLSMGRRFQGNIEDQDGSINKAKRSEVYTKHFFVKDIVDPSKVEKSYEEGILKLKIAKR